MPRSKSRFSSAPIAPYKASAIQRWRVSRLGRLDAKNHKGIADGTLTQSLKEIQTYAHLGQLEVNRWFRQQSEPITQGNSRISIQLQQLDKDIENLEANLGDTGRQRKFNLKLLEVLNEKKVSQRAQFEMNKDSLEALHIQASDALDSWVRHYVALAAIYGRSLSKKLKRDVRSSDAEVPPFESVPLISLEDR